MAAKDTTPPREHERRTQFADLVKRRREELGLSLRKFAEQAVDPVTGEQVVKYSWLQRLESYEDVIPPQLPELRGLAVAARVPLEAMQDAAGQQFHGVDPAWSESGEAKAYVRRLDSLRPEQREQLMRFLDTFTSSDDVD